MAQAESGEVLLATLGVEPQVITIALDSLLRDGCRVGEVTVIYTDSPGVRDALRVLEAEFAGPAYPGVSLRAVMVTGPGGPVRDFVTEDDLRGLLGTLYREVCRTRRAGSVVHLCLSGGRKVMGIMAMVVAQLLFGPEDRAWYLITEGWRPGGDRNLHPPLDGRVRLVPVPVLRWHQASTLMRTVAELNDPAEVVAWYERLTRDEQFRRKGEFIRHWLTPAEREVVRLACRGLDNAAIAKSLFKREQTVANQLRGVYEKLRELLGQETGVDRNVLIAEFAPYFAWMEDNA
ncbi:MAG: CRISPR-associated ring nuclease [Bacillota bacterium]